MTHTRLLQIVIVAGILVILGLILTAPPDKKRPELEARWEMGRNATNPPEFIGTNMTTTTITNVPFLTLANRPMVRLGNGTILIPLTDAEWQQVAAAYSKQVVTNTLFFSK